MLLTDRMFRRRGLNTARIGALERLAYIGSNAMGAMAFEPVAPEGEAPDVHIPLEQHAAEVQDVLHGEGASSCRRCCGWAARPKVHGPRS